MDDDEDFKRHLLSMPDLPVCRLCTRSFFPRSEKVQTEFCHQCLNPEIMWVLEADSICTPHVDITITTQPIRSRVTKMKPNARVHILKNRTLPHARGGLRP